MFAHCVTISMTPVNHRYPETVVSIIRCAISLRLIMWHLYLPGEGVKVTDTTYNDDSDADDVNDDMKETECRHQLN